MSAPAEQRRHAVRRRRGRARAPARSTSSRTTTRASSGCCVPAKGRGAAVASGAARTDRLPAELPDVPRRQPAGHRYRRAARASGRRSPANNIAAGAPRFDAAAIRAVLAAGKNRMPPFPHLSTADVDNLVELPHALPAGGRGRGGSGGGRGAGPVGSGAPPELIAGSGSAWVRPDAAGGRGRGAAPYPEGTPDYTRYTINEYHTVGNGIKPPFTTIVKFDLNEPAIKWRIPLRRRSGAGRARHHRHRRAGDQQRHHPHRVRPRVRRRARQSHPRVGQRDGQGIVVVEIRRQLHRLAGDVRHGRQAVSARRRREQPAPGPGCPRRRCRRPAGAMGWVAYALPGHRD